MASYPATARIAAYPALRSIVARPTAYSTSSVSTVAGISTANQTSRSSVIAPGRLGSSFSLNSRNSCNSWLKRPAAYARLGFEIPDIWVVGYGLDYADMFRTLPYIAALEREGYESR